MRMLVLVGTIFGIGPPYMASAFFIFLLRETFLQERTEFDDVARIEGASPLGLIRRACVLLGRPAYIGFGLRSV